MKYFSVSFIPEKNDINKKAIFLNLFSFDKNRLMPKIGIISAFVIFAIFLKQFELAFYAVISLLFVPKAAETVLLLSQIEKGDTDLSKRPVTLDFYSDHFVYRYTPTEKFRGNFEKHYSFRKVTGVIESNNAIAFTFGENETVLIPKRAINEETGVLISNLINNLFKSKFIKVNI